MRSLLTVFVTLLISTVSASEFKVGNNAIRSVYDGDSFNVAFRLAHIDTPEIRGKCAREKRLAIQARDFTRAFFKANRKIDIKVVTIGKYGRPIVEVRSESGYLNQMLLEKQLARPYQGSRSDWCAPE